MGKVLPILGLFLILGCEASSPPPSSPGTPPGPAPSSRPGPEGDRITAMVEVEELTEGGVRLTWSSGQASALDHSRISLGRDVGTIRVRDGQGRDVAHDVLFAFAFHAFFPDGEWMLGE